MLFYVDIPVVRRERFAHQGSGQSVPQHRCSAVAHVEIIDVAAVMNEMMGRGVEYRLEPLLHPDDSFGVDAGLPGRYKKRSTAVTPAVSQCVSTVRQCVPCAVSQRLLPVSRMRPEHTALENRAD